jgi:hypothetical protein
MNIEIWPWSANENELGDSFCYNSHLRPDVGVWTVVTNFRRHLSQLFMRGP